MGEITVTRYHDFCAGHRVVGHENKCAHLHGHNYRAYFTILGKRDSVGRVLDFSVIKELLCEWLEENWDHKFLFWQEDGWGRLIKKELDSPVSQALFDGDIGKGLVIVPFNPTAENMAEHLVLHVAPELLKDTTAELVSCTIQETRKCSATYTKEGRHG